MKIFYQLLGNTLIASVTNFTVWFALTYFVYLETHSVFASSIVGGCFLVATAASGIWFGSLVDHHKKKTMMLLSSVISLAAYSVGFAMYLAVGREAFSTMYSWELWVFIPLMLLGVMIGNIRNIAMPTIVTILFKADERDKANGLSGTAFGISFLITSVISGVLVGFGGMFYVLILAIVCTLLTIAHLWFIPVPEKEVAHGDDDGPKKIDIRGTIKAIRVVPGLLALLFFATFNNFLGGVFMSLMDPYGLSLVSVQTWGFLWGGLSLGFMVGGLLIAKFGLGKNPLRSLFLANIVIWMICALFTVQESIILLLVGMFIYLCVVPYIEASEQTIIQKVVPQERQGRVFGFAQSVEQAASPLTAFMIGPLAQFIFIPFMTTGAGVDLIGSWFGVGEARGMALVFTITGIIGLCVTLIAMRSRFYRELSNTYLKA